MKRNISIAVLLAGILLAGQFGVTRATKPGRDSTAEGNGLKQFVSQELIQEEFIRAETERVNLGFALSPVPMRLGIGKTRIMIGLGSYLVNTGGCSGCHTSPLYAPGGNPFMGQPERINTGIFMAGGRPFGPFTSRNLTPDPNKGNRPGGLFLDEFIRTMRTGEDLKKLHPQMGPLLQVMPWPEFDRLSDRDLEAMYAYLSAIPHADTPAPAN